MKIIHMTLVLVTMPLIITLFLVQFSYLKSREILDAMVELQ